MTWPTFSSFVGHATLQKATAQGTLIRRTETRSKAPLVSGPVLQSRMRPMGDSMTRPKPLAYIAHCFWAISASRNRRWSWNRARSGLGPSGDHRAIAGAL